MLTIEQVKTRIEKWEDHSTEFKLRFTSDPIRQTIVAFANDYNEIGQGVIIIGIDPNSREIVGIDEDPEELTRRITGLCRDGSIVPTIAPVIYTLEIDRKTIAIIEIKRSARRPHRANNICYIRIGPTTRKATPDEEFECIRRSGIYPYDLMPLHEASVDDLNLFKFESEFLSKRLSYDVLSDHEYSAIEWAEHLKFLIREGNSLFPTVAAILLFGKNPQRFLPHSSIDFIKFNGEDPSYPIDKRINITGTLDELIKSAQETIELYMVQRYVFSEQTPVRKDIYEYPLRAVRECIANAIIHRDYEISRANVVVKMFDNRLEIQSPGGLYGIVTKENFGTGVNDYRNPTIATALNIFGFVEKAGTGIFLIRRQMQKNSALDPTFEIGDRHLLVTLPAHPYHRGYRLYKKGVTELEQGNRDEAKRLFLDSLELIPHLPEVWASLGRWEALYGDTEVAREAFQKAIINNSQFERAYLEWGKLEDQQGNIARSREIFRQGTEAIPNSAPLWYAWALLEIKVRRFKTALAFLKKAVVIQPDDYRLLRLLGNIAYRLGDYDLAIEHFLKALECTENSKQKGPIFLELMKTLIENNSDKDNIEECFENALMVDFRTQELFYQFHKYLTNKGDHAKSLEVLELARQEGLDITPSLPVLYIGRIPTYLPKKQLRKEIEKFFGKEGIGISKIYTSRRGFGFITVTSDADAKMAIQKLNGKDFYGKKIIVNFKRKD